MGKGLHPITQSDVDRYFRCGWVGGHFGTNVTHYGDEVPWQWNCVGWCYWGRLMSRWLPRVRWVERWRRRQQAACDRASVAAGRWG